jgi:hypothetical protein
MTGCLEIRDEIMGFSPEVIDFKQSLVIDGEGKDLAAWGERVPQLAGLWMRVFDHLKDCEQRAGYEFESGEVEREHAEFLGLMRSLGCDLISLLQKVEDSTGQSYALEQKKLIFGIKSLTMVQESLGA